MKGFIVSEVVTVIHLVALLVILTVAIVVVIFTFNHQIRFSTEYASIVNKPYSISEPLLIRKIDDRTVIDHSFASVLTGDVKLSEINGNFAVDIRTFLDLYSLKYYHFKIDKSETLLKVSTIKQFCGTRNNDEIVNTCGYDGHQPCIAYCESGTKIITGYTTVSYGNDIQVAQYKYICSSSGKTQYGPGSSKCKDSSDAICCIEKSYDWSTKVFVTLDQGEKTCASGKGICSRTCAAGRDEGPVDRACKFTDPGLIYNSYRQDKCCIPRDGEDVNSVEDKSSEAVIPILYKQTKNDASGVIGYVKIGVGSD